MDKLKVLSMAKIKELLGQGYYLRYDTIGGHVVVMSSNWVTLGYVRFDTYLKLCNHYVHDRRREEACNWQYKWLCVEVMKW